MKMKKKDVGRETHSLASKFTLVRMLQSLSCYCFKGNPVLFCCVTVEKEKVLGGLLSGFLKPQERVGSSGAGRELLLPPLQNGSCSEVQLLRNMQNQVCVCPSVESKI